MKKTITIGMETSAKVRNKHTHRENGRKFQQVQLAFISASFLYLAFRYESDIEYSAHPKVTIDSYGRRMSPLL